MQGVMSLMLAVLTTGALAWEQPQEWPDIGMVSKWKEYDARFYRTYQDGPFLDESQFKFDQVKQYAKTREYSGSLDGIGLETFLKKDADEQAQRRKLAAKELKFVADFHQRMQTMIQRVRDQQGSGWGEQIADQTVIGDCLGKLRTAVGLDPSNPYAWHVLGYFANIVGDKARANAALAHALAALTQVPPDQLVALRAEVALDMAWLQRDLGKFEKASSLLKSAVEYGAKGTEPRLLQGLIAAQTGETQKATAIASALRSAEVRVFPPNLKTSSFEPELADVAIWRKRTSNYLQSWILALTWLDEGNLEMATGAFGAFSFNDYYPFAQRFWNDAGRIYEMTGRRSLAQKAWSMARINVPYIVYFVYKPYAADLGGLTGRPGAVPFYLGFDLFFLGGSRLAYGEVLVQGIAAAEDEIDKQEIGMKALDELELLQATGNYPAQAQVLKGQAFYLLGDLGSALLEVQGALETMEKQGDKVGIAAVLQGLAKGDADLKPTDVANFYSQAGSGDGRWLKPQDLEAQQDSLRRAYAGEPSDENRHALAKFLIRNGDPVEGRELALAPLKGQKLGKDNIRQLSGDDMALVLEADRAEGEDELALTLVRALEGGAEDPWNHPVMWIYAGFICLDGNDMPEARVALERAQELDPGNQALKVQLAIMAKDAN
jgi:cytochrome c-type biogenesis protein CcmH/NrfG